MNLAKTLKMSFDHAPWKCISLKMKSNEIKTNFLVQSA